MSFSINKQSSSFHFCFTFTNTTHTQTFIHIILVGGIYYNKTLLYTAFMCVLYFILTWLCVFRIFQFRDWNRHTTSQLVARYDCDKTHTQLKSESVVSWTAFYWYRDERAVSLNFYFEFKSVLCALPTSQEVREEK